MGDTTRENEVLMYKYIKYAYKNIVDSAPSLNRNYEGTQYFV